MQSHAVALAAWTGGRLPSLNWNRHEWRNRLQTLLLVLALLGICTLAGSLLFGEPGMWIALVASLVALLIEPAATARLTLTLYRARPIAVEEAPELWRVARVLAGRSDLSAIPVLHYVASPVVNAFAVGNRRHSAIALTDGLLRTLTMREIAGVLAHETAHIAHDDLRVMGLADYVSRLTSMFALVGQLLLVLALPSLMLGAAAINWPGLALLVLSPHLALLAQLGLSRVREFDADLKATQLTGDPLGLASALARIEQATRSWRAWLMPGWGNPEPSWLRTHPVTEERIRRLLSLAPQTPETGPGQSAPVFVSGPAPARRNPRWHPGGYWR